MPAKTATLASQVEPRPLRKLSFGIPAKTTIDYGKPERGP